MLTGTHSKPPTNNPKLHTNRKYCDIIFLFGIGIVSEWYRYGIGMVSEYRRIYRTL